MNLLADSDSTSGKRPQDGRSWRLLENGLLVFVRALSPSGPFRLLLARVSFCTHRECQCRDVSMTAIGFDVGTADPSCLGLASEQLGSMLDGPQAMNFALDLDLGLVEPDEFKGRAPLSSDWVEYVTAQVDGELLDELHNGWLHAKRFRRGKPNEIRWPVQDPAELVGWYALHPEDRRDCYLHEGRVFETEDLYCANPSCPCDEATLYFTEIADRDRAVPVGHLRVGLPNIQVLEWKPRGDQALLEQLWKTFQTRHRRAGERLMARKRHVIELARLRAEKQAPVVAPDRVGRNAPCPCGSGKKFKRCCAT